MFNILPFPRLCSSPVQHSAVSREIFRNSDYCSFLPPVRIMTFSCWRFCCPPVQHSAVFVPISVILFSNILQSSHPVYCRLDLQYSVILIANILQSLRLKYCHTAVRYFAILISNILWSSRPMYCLPAVHICTLPLSHILQYSGPMCPSVYFSAVLLLDAPTTYADTSGLKCNKEKENHTIIKCNCIFGNQNQKLFWIFTSVAKIQAWA
jgi:hypothetical protein